MKLVNCILPVVAFAVACVMPAKGDLILNVTISPTSPSCLSQAAGLKGTLDLTATGVNLDFGSAALYGTTEPCGARLANGSQAFTGTTPAVGTVFAYTGSICELQGTSDGCNGIPPKSLDSIQFEFTSPTQAFISDVAAGGSLDIVVNVATVPEPSLYLLVGGVALMLGASRRARMRR